MEKKELGRFYAIAFDETVYEFIVYEDYMACPLLGAERITHMDLKPRFSLSSRYTHNLAGYIMPVVGGDSKGLIKTYDIDDVLFTYLKLKRMISYSTDMAYLYGFPEKKGFDAYDQKRAFKRTRPEKILVKQKQGIFN